MSFITGLIIGSMLGGTLGVFFMCCCQINKDEN